MSARQTIKKTHIKRATHTRGGSGRHTRKGRRVKYKKITQRSR